MINKTYKKVEEYRDTVLGPLPYSWKLIPLNDVAEVKTGPFGSALHAANYVQSGTPIITVEHLSEHGIIHSNLPEVNDIDKERLKSYVLAEEDIVFSRVGSVDRNSIVKSKEQGWLFSGRLLRIRTNKHTINARYLSQYFNYTRVKQRIRTIAVGQTMASLNTKLLNSFLIVKPTLEEQKAIAEVLTDTDSLIQFLEKLIDKKKKIKQGAMKQLLTGKKRLPGYSKDFDNVKVKDIGHAYGGLSGKSKIDFEVGNKPYITFLNVMNNTKIKIEELPQVRIKDSESQNKVNTGDLLFNTSSETPEEVGMCSVLTNKVDELYLNSFCFGFRVYDDKLFDPLYLAYFFRSNEGRKLFFSLAQGATRYNLSKRLFYNIEFKIPEFQEQSAIAQVLSDMDAEIEVLREKLEKYKKIKQGIMRELLTGRIRLI